MMGAVLLRRLPQLKTKTKKNLRKSKATCKTFKGLIRKKSTKDKAGTEGTEGGETEGGEPGDAAEADDRR